MVAVATTQFTRGVPVVASLIAGLLALATSGCDGFGKLANPQVPLWEHHPGNALVVENRRELTANTRKSGEGYERSTPTIDAAHRRVFVGSRDHGFYALNATTLSTLWRFETGGAVQSEALYDLREDAVYFGSNDGAIYKLRASDGKMLWRFSSQAEVTRRPVLHRGTLFVMNANDTLLAIDPASGKMRWYRHRTPAAGMEIAGYAGPAVHGNNVYAAFSDGVLMAYHGADGSETFAGPIDLTAQAEQSKGEDLRYFDIDTTPVVTTVKGKAVLMLASYEGGIYAFDAESGESLWINEAATGVTELTLWEAEARPDSHGQAVDADGRHRVLVASSGLTGLWGVNPSDGSELWRRDLPQGGISKPVAFQGALLVGTTRYGLFLVHPLDGGVIDGVHSGGAFAAAPAAHGRHAFVMSNEGVFWGLSVVPPGPKTTHQHQGF